MNVIMTGASGGLGRALAVECARRGYKMILTDVDEEGLRLIKRGIEREFDATVITRVCDLTQGKSVDQMLEWMEQQALYVDMLLNIAGLDYEGGFMERDREKLVEIVSLNDAATMRITHALLGRRRAGRRFSIVFVSNLASMFPMPLKAIYAASKRFSWILPHPSAKN